MYLSMYINALQTIRLTISDEYDEYDNEPDESHESNEEKMNIVNRVSLYCI